MTDTATAAEPITLEAFDTASLLMDANARTDAEATVTPGVRRRLRRTPPPRQSSPSTRTGLAGPSAATRSRSRSAAAPTASLRVRDGHRRNIVLHARRRCRPGLRRRRRGRRAPPTPAPGSSPSGSRTTTASTSNHPDDTALLLALFTETAMTEAGIAKATGLKRPEVKAVADRRPVRGSPQGRRPVGVPDPGPGRRPDRVRE